MGTSVRQTCRMVSVGFTDCVSGRAAIPLQVTQRADVHARECESGLERLGPNECHPMAYRYVEVTLGDYI